MMVLNTPPKWNQIDCFGFNSPNNQEQKPKVDKAKYKTEMCRQWQKNQTCSYGRKCQFAHGVQEMIQTVNTNPNYKSRKCNSFHKKGVCPYGIRCKFIHETVTFEEITNSSYYQRLLAFPELKHYLPPRKRLQVFEELTSSNYDYQMIQDQS